MIPSSELSTFPLKVIWLDPESKHLNARRNLVIFFLICQDKKLRDSFKMSYVQNTDIEDSTRLSIQVLQWIFLLARLFCSNGSAQHVQRDPWPAA
jgi:hypothetical protein